MYKKIFLLFFISCMGIIAAQAQATKKTAVDSLAYYDDLFNELEDFIDSLTAPRSFAIVNVGIGNGYMNYETASNINPKKKTIFTPSFGYYHKNGLGINATAAVINETGKFNMYQLATTASYDYLQNRKFMTGVSFTHFFTKDSLTFYTSPLSNTAYGYFSYRGWWLKPTLGVNYGWGSRTTVRQQEQIIKLLKKLQQTTVTTTETTEHINDLTITASVKRDFYWLNVVTAKDYFRLSPAFIVTTGTQKYGINQTNTSYLSSSKTGINVLNNSETTYLTSASKFQLLFLSAQLRSEFSKGRFFVQPQIMFDYCLPAPDHQLTTSFALNTGIIL
jgi:hypothetical protein